MDQFSDWLQTTYPSAFFFRLERAGGGRQDLGFDGALPIFIDRAILTEFLSRYVMLPDHSNILEAYLWAVLGSQEMVRRRLPPPALTGAPPQRMDSE
eukprot:4159736-Prymnesium_polylepis.1